MTHDKKAATINSATIIKEWDELTLADNFIFQKVMLNEELCKKILSEILGTEVTWVEYPDYEKTIAIRRDSKAIRLDIHIKGADSVYNIEMQNVDSPYLPLRERYYADLIDLDFLEKGHDYEELGKSFVIFICTFDHFGLDYYKYTFTNKCNEVPGLELGDETTKILLNTYGKKGDVSDDLKDFLKAVNDVFSNSEFSATIKSEVDKVKRSNHFRREYMNLYIHDQDLRKAVTKEVTEKVRLKDIVALIKVSQDLGASREITISKIMENYSLPEDEIIALVNENWK